jgi:hypothetical protein
MRLSCFPIKYWKLLIDRHTIRYQPSHKNEIHDSIPFFSTHHCELTYYQLGSCEGVEKKNIDTYAAEIAEAARSASQLSSSSFFSAFVWLW